MKFLEEIKELNQLLPQDFRVAEVQNDVQKKEIINKALDFAGFKEGYLKNPTEEEKPKTSVWGCCCTQPPVSTKGEVTVDSGRWLKIIISKQMSCVYHL